MPRKLNMKPTLLLHTARVPLYARRSSVVSSPSTRAFLVLWVLLLVLLPLPLACCVNQQSTRWTHSTNIEPSSISTDSIRRLSLTMIKRSTAHNDVGKTVLHLATPALGKGRKLCTREGNEEDDVCGPASVVRR